MTDNLKTVGFRGTIDIINDLIDTILTEAGADLKNTQNRYWAVKALIDLWESMKDEHPDVKAWIGMAFLVQMKLRAQLYLRRETLVEPK